MTIVALPLLVVGFTRAAPDLYQRWGGLVLAVFVAGASILGTLAFGLATRDLMARVIPRSSQCSSGRRSSPWQLDSYCWRFSFADGIRSRGCSGPGATCCWGLWSGSWERPSEASWLQALASCC
jgi:hypothetical protein